MIRRYDKLIQITCASSLKPTRNSLVSRHTKAKLTATNSSIDTKFRIEQNNKKQTSFQSITIQIKQRKPQDQTKPALPTKKQTIHLLG